MRWTSIIAIYCLFWVMSAFVVLPFGVRTPHESGEALVPGQSHSAPSNFRPLRTVIATTIVSMLLFGIYYVVYVNQWVTADDINWVKYVR